MWPFEGPRRMTKTTRLSVPTEIRSSERKKVGFIYPEKWIKCSILHKLCDNHCGPALGDHTLQPDDVGLVKLAHDWCLGQEVSPLPLRVANLQGLDGHGDFLFPNRLQATFVHLSKLTCRWKAHMKWNENIQSKTNSITGAIREPTESVFFYSTLLTSACK